MELGKTLIQEGLLSNDQLAQVEQMRLRDGRRLDHLLIAEGFIDEDVLLRIVSKQLHLPLINLSEIKPDQATIDSLPTRLVYRKRLVPVELKDGILTVASCDPFDMQVFDELRLITGYDISPALAPS